MTTRIAMVLEGPGSGQASEQISSMLFTVIAQNDVILKKFEMDDLSVGSRDSSTEVTVPGFMREKNRSS
ncbi:MAG: hypothetical protein K2I96_12175 [Lachnospiraceae bacterium]|nr:hypothetical protein [Lachnospiraceae bacterium]